MSDSQGIAAPESGSDNIPTFVELAADPEIAALLDFEPVPMRPRVNGWNAEAQRAFIAFLAITGSKQRAATAIGRVPASLDRIFKRDDAASFCEARDRAMALFEQNHTERLAEGFAARRRADPGIEAPGQALNEFGEWEDEESLHRRAEEARDSIARKLLMARRLYLREISGSAGKRAAFEILTDLPVDWEKAKALEPQPDEPWRSPNMRQPDMLMTAENGWMADIVGGPEQIARHRTKVRRAIDKYRAERGMPPVEWESVNE